MYQMIAEYEKSRKLLETRVHELNVKLRDPELRTIERERLEHRRDLLTAERVDMLHAIRELRLHIYQEKEEINGDPNLHGKDAIRQNGDTGHAQQAGHQPGTSENRTTSVA